MWLPGAHLSAKFRSKLTGLLLFLSLLSYPLSILCIRREGGSVPLSPPSSTLGVVGSFRVEVDLPEGISCWAVKTSAPSEAGSPPSRGVYPAWRRLSRVKMLSMLSTSLRGLHAGRGQPPPPEELLFDSLLVLSASQSCSLPEQGALRGAFRGGGRLEEPASGDNTAPGRE